MLLQRRGAEERDRETETDIDIETDRELTLVKYVFRFSAA